MKRFFRILRNLLVLILLVLIAVAFVWRREIASLRTVHSVADNGYLYQMDSFLISDRP